MRRIAIVGYGYWGPKLTRNFMQNGAFDRVVACEEDPARLKRAKRENPGAEAVASFARVLAETDIDGVALATPVASHHAQALATCVRAKHGVGSALHFPLALHPQRCFVELGYKRGDFPVSDRAGETCLSLPRHPQMPDVHVDHVAATIAEFKDW